MFKKIAHLIVVSLLLIATGGIPFTRHYCGSTAKSFSIFSIPKSCCDSHCDKCHNIFKFSKINDAFEAESSFITQDHSQVLILQTAQFVELFDHLPIFPTLSPIIEWNIIYPGAGHSPAFLGNFRC